MFIDKKSKVHTHCSKIVLRSQIPSPSIEIARHVGVPCYTSTFRRQYGLLIALPAPTLKNISGIPLACREHVFRSLSSNLASDRLRRIPDGETSSQRQNFTAWQYMALVRAGKTHLLGNPFEHNNDALSFTEDEVRKEMVDFPDLDTQ